MSTYLGIVADLTSTCRSTSCPGNIERWCNNISVGCIDRNRAGSTAFCTEKISLLESLASKYFVLVEYGLQSIYDESLEFIKRGHDYSSFLRAVEMTRDRGIHIGVHLIAGFPTETRVETLSMAEEVSHLPIEFLKLHQLQIVKDTPLEIMFKENPFPVFGYQEYLDFVADFVEKTAPHIVFQRLFATAPDNILIAPEWGRNRHRILSDIEKNLEARDILQGRKFRLQPVSVKS